MSARPSPNVTVSTNRAYALDALRGLAILAMLLSGQMPFGSHALPAWMYHAQEPPPSFEFRGDLPGISWVDLVFPFFLFSMGAAFPLAFARRMENKTPRWKLFLFILERGFLLAFFALFVMAIRPYVLRSHPTTATWFLALGCFFLLFLILTRLPDTWSKAVRWSIRGAGWLGAILFFIFARYPDSTVDNVGFDLNRADIIIVVLTNMAVFGSLVWMFTRENLVLRLGVMGIVFAIRMSNLPEPTDGWVHDLWQLSPLPSLYRLYFLQYLCIVIPGTIAGDLILQWTRRPAPAKNTALPPGAALVRYVFLILNMVALVLVTLIGLKSRWLLGTTLTDFALCLTGWWLLRKPADDHARLYQTLFNWAVYWLVLGLIFEPYEGGIKKDHPTMSYYFVTSGLAICVFTGFSILIDVFRQKRWLWLLIDNGQNPMIAYAGINNFITPLLALVGGNVLLDHFASTPWRGFWSGAIITLLMALTVSFLTRKKIFWRT